MNLAVLISLAAPLAPMNGCRCENLNKTVAAFSRLAAGAVLVKTGEVLVCQNGLRRGGRHSEGRAIDFVLASRQSYSDVVELASETGPAATAFHVAGQLAKSTGMRWGYLGWPSSPGPHPQEFGHFERPGGVYWPNLVTTFLIHVFPNLGGCLP